MEDKPILYNSYRQDFLFTHQPSMLQGIINQLSISEINISGMHTGWSEMFE